MYTMSQFVRPFTAQQGVLVVDGRHPGTQITVIGCSTKVSIDNLEPVHNITISKTNHNLDVIALHVVHIDKKPSGNVRTEYDGLVEINWGKGEPFIVERPWTSRPDRIGQVLGRVLHVRSGGNLYATQTPSPDQVAKMKEGSTWYHVPDGDLLCAFLADQVGVEQLTDAAATQVVNQRLEQQLEGLRHSFSEVVDAKQTVVAERDAWEATARMMFDHRNKIVVELKKWKWWGWKERFRALVATLNREYYRNQGGSVHWIDHLESLD